MDFRFGYHNSCPSGIFDSILSLSLFSANTTNTSLLMVSVKCLDIFDLKSLHVKIIQSENGNRILNFKSEHKGLQEICCFLDGSNILGEVAGPELHSSPLGVHSDLQLHVLHQSFEDAIPI